MAFEAIGALLELGGRIVDRVIPDPAAKAAANLELLKLAQTGELAQLNADLEMAKGQMAINQAEAAAPDLFTRGWRPFVGWVCGVGLAVQFLVGPLLTWAADLFGRKVAFPQLDMETLLTLLLGMLGLGVMRTVEKVKRAT